MTKLFGAMEGGGTKFVCIVGTKEGEILEKKQLPTRQYEETIAEVISFFKNHKLSALGLAPFGPLDLSADSATFGNIIHTPKSGWSGVEILAPFSKEFSFPLAIDTDVNAAALGEYTYVQKNKNLETMAYMTIGTGIGAGLIANGRIVHGLSHPEAGHMHLPHDWKTDPFPGICPFHGDCFEGLASGPALAERTGKQGSLLPKEHPVWKTESKYIAIGILNIIYIFSPQRIILGGGVMKQDFLFPMIRDDVQKLINGYLVSPSLTKNMKEYIVPPSLGSLAGSLGALTMAVNAYEGIHA